MRYKLTITYDGSQYNGWQVQPNGITVQEVLSQHIEKILQTRISLVGSGRTDTGVHALGQVAHFSAEKTFSPDHLRHSLNLTLPKDIRILSLEAQSNDFHSQKSAKEKTYCYVFYLHPISSPFLTNYTWHVTYPLDVDKMEKAALAIIGKHDFRAFANESYQGACARNPFRTIYQASFELNAPFLYFEITADGFFYKMVRNIVGTLMDIGRGKLKVEDMARILESCDRNKASPAAPAEGLYLHHLNYPKQTPIFAKGLFPHLQRFHKNRIEDLD